MQTLSPARAPRSPIQASPATTVLEMTSPSRSSTSPAQVLSLLLSLQGSECSGGEHRRVLARAAGTEAGLLSSQRLSYALYNPPTP